VGSLTATRQTAPMTQPAVATEVHEPLDVHVDLTTKVTFDLEVLVDAFADPLDVGLVEIVSTLALRDTRSDADRSRRCIAAQSPCVSDLEGRRLRYVPFRSYPCRCL
jgi:hypothetical protein